MFNAWHTKVFYTWHTKYDSSRKRFFIIMTLIILNSPLRPILRIRARMYNACFWVTWQSSLETITNTILCSNVSKLMVACNIANVNPICQLCSSNEETLEQFVLHCTVLENARNSVINDISHEVNPVLDKSCFTDLTDNEKIQIILDCTVLVDQHHGKLQLDHLGSLESVDGYCTIYWPSDIPYCKLYPRNNARTMPYKDVENIYQFTQILETSHPKKKRKEKKSDNY